MRTKNAKRLWPVPATLAVVALAAFLAFGLMATTGAQPAAAQSAEPDVKIDPASSTSLTESVAGRTLTIELAGLDTSDALDNETKKNYFVYALGATISGGSSIGTAYPEDTNTATEIAARSAHTVHFRRVTLDPPTFDGNQVRNPATETLTITRGSLKVAPVYIYAASPAVSFIEEDVPIDGDEIDRVRDPVSTVTTSVTVTFQDPADPDNSNIDIGAGGTDDGDVDLGTQSHANVTVSTTLMITVQDGADTPNNLEGKVTITVGGPDTVILQQVIEDDDDKVGKSITVDTDSDGETGAINVIGIPGAGAVRIPVDATFGSVSLKTKYIVRVGPAHVIEAGIYNFANSDCVNQGNDLDANGQPLAAAAAMMNDSFDPTDDDCEMDMRFGRGEKFVIDVSVEDVLGSETSDNVDMTLPDVDDLLEDAVEYGEDGVGPSATEVFDVYEVGAKAPFGMQTIMLALDDNDDVADVQLMFYVAGPPTEFVVDPMVTYIPLRSRDTFTVTALDTTNGIPHFADDMASMVQIDAPYGEVRGVMVDPNDVLTLDMDTGMGTFTYTLPRDAAAGETFSIFVGEGDMEVEITVTAGDAPTAPGMPMNVMAMATSHDMITVTWDAADDGGSDITGYMVQRGYMDADNMMMWMDRGPGPHGHGHDVHGHGPHGRDHVLLPSRRHELRRHG